MIAAAAPFSAVIAGDGNSAAIGNAASNINLFINTPPGDWNGESEAKKIPGPMAIDLEIPCFSARSSGCFSVRGNAVIHIRQVF
jgi:hypothetical protein